MSLIHLELHPQRMRILVVQFAPGTNNDVLARILSRSLALVGYWMVINDNRERTRIRDRCAFRARWLHAALGSWTLASPSMYTISQLGPHQGFGPIAQITMH